MDLQISLSKILRFAARHSLKFRDFRLIELCENGLVIIMGWSPVNAVNAYLETVKLCKLNVEKKSTELESTEMISALAAGMNAQLIVEVCSAPTSTTIALSAAARQINGRFVCILPAKSDSLQADSVKAMKEFGLEDTTDFVIGEANELLPCYKNVDFCLIDCKTQDCSALFKLLNVNPSGAVVVANNLFDRKTIAAYDKTFKKKPGAKSTSLPIGKGLEMTRIGSYDPCASQTEKGRTLNPERRCYSHSNIKGNQKCRWIMHVDERTGEEHVFRVRKHKDQF